MTLPQRRGGTCQSATLYANYSTSGGPKDKIGSVAKGEVVGYQYTNGSWALVRTGGDKIGFILRDCITVPQAGTSGSYLWPAKINCQDATLYASYNFATNHPGKKIGVVTRGQKVGYQYYNGNLSTGAYTAIRKGHEEHSALRVRPARLRQRRRLGTQGQLEPRAITPAHRSLRPGPAAGATSRPEAVCCAAR